MIISRKVHFSKNAAAQLRKAQLTEDDDRVAAAIWYFKHDTRLSRLRPVKETASGLMLSAFQTKATRHRPRLVLYVTVKGGMQDITIEGLLLPAGSEDD